MIPRRKVCFLYFMLTGTMDSFGQEPLKSVGQKTVELLGQERVALVGQETVEQFGLEPWVRNFEC